MSIRFEENIDGKVAEFEGSDGNQPSDLKSGADRCKQHISPKKSVKYGICLFYA